MAMSAAVPMGLVAFAAIMITFTGLVRADQASAPSIDCSSFDVLHLVTCPASIVSVILDILTFNIDGAPWWVRTPMTIMMVVPLGWMVVAVLLEVF